LCDIQNPFEIRDINITQLLVISETHPL
jgi:hypothetical protein